MYVKFAAHVTELIQLFWNIPRAPLPVHIIAFDCCRKIETLSSPSFLQFNSSQSITQTSKKGNQTLQTYGPLLNDVKELLKSSQDIQIQDFFEMYEQVLASGKYNFEGVRIPSSTRLNIPFFRFMLYGYEDTEITDLIEFGFPICFVGKLDWHMTTTKS